MKSKPQTRMAKVLGSLVGAMTVGALVLHWIEPPGPQADNGYAIQLRAIEAKQVVRADSFAPLAHWQGVIIRVAPSSQPHFQVTATGKYIRTERWYREAATGAEGFIEVGLEPARLRNGQMPPQQMTALVALLFELQRAFLPDGGRVELDERSFAAGGRNANQVEKVRALLRSAGLG